jgi:hypothetical protein
MIEQDAINKFYSQMTETADEAEIRLAQFPYSGISLINKIAPNETVIDIGCGHNIFKKYIPNLVGIDPVYKNADYLTTLENFTTDKKFNVAFCLGSIQYGTTQDIEAQVAKVIDLLTPSARIYWRSKIKNPLAAPKNYDFTIYRWTEGSHTEIAEKFGFKLVDYKIENYFNDQHSCRLYAEWARP